MFSCSMDLSIYIAFRIDDVYLNSCITIRLVFERYWPRFGVSSRGGRDGFFLLDGFGTVLEFVF